MKRNSQKCKKTCFSLYFPYIFYYIVPYYMFFLIIILSFWKVTFFYKCSWCFFTFVVDLWPHLFYICGTLYFCWSNTRGPSTRRGRATQPGLPLPPPPPVLAGDKEDDASHNTHHKARDSPSWATPHFLKSKNQIKKMSNFKSKHFLKSVWGRDPANPLTSIKISWHHSQYIWNNPSVLLDDFCWVLAVKRVECLN